MELPPSGTQGMKLGLPALLIQQLYWDMLIPCSEPEAASNMNKWFLPYVLVHSQETLFLSDSFPYLFFLLLLFVCFINSHIILLFVTQGLSHENIGICFVV